MANERDDNDIVLRVSPSQKAFVVEEHKPGDVLSYKEISPIDLYYAINKSYHSTIKLDSGLLPQNCIHVSISSTEKHFVLWNRELYADVNYCGTEYPNFPLPRLVFGVRMLPDGKVADCTMGVVADETPNLSTKMFQYPFSNVSDFRVCVGNNTLPKYAKQTALEHFPSYLLGLPDNDDSYRAGHNKAHLEHRELLNRLKNKDPAYYYTDVLIESGKTLNDFINWR